MMRFLGLPPAFLFQLGPCDVCRGSWTRTRPNSSRTTKEPMHRVLLASIAGGELWGNGIWQPLDIKDVCLLKCELLFFNER